MRKNNNMLKGKWKIEGVRFFLHPPKKKKCSVLAFLWNLSNDPLLTCWIGETFPILLEMFLGPDGTRGSKHEARGEFKTSFLFFRVFTQQVSLWWCMHLGFKKAGHFFYSSRTKKKQPSQAFWVMKPQLPWFGYSKKVTDIPAEYEISATTKDMAKREVIQLMVQKSGQQQLSSGSF